MLGRRGLSNGNENVAKQSRNRKSKISGAEKRASLGPARRLRQK